MTSALLETLVGHRARVLACAFSPDGSRIVSADAAGVVKIWDASRGVEAVSFVAAKGAAFESCRLAWNGARIETAWSPGETQWWDAATGARVPVDGDRTVFASTRDGSRAVAVKDGSAVLRDIAADEETPVGSGVSASSRWTFSPDGSRIAARISGPQPCIALWSGITGVPIANLPDADGAFAFSPRSDRLVTSGPRLWDAADGRELIRAASNAGSPMSACVFSSDASRIAAAFVNGRLGVFDAQTCTAIFEVDAHAPSARAGCRFVANGTQLLSWGDRLLKVWDASSGSLLAVYEGHTSAVNDADVSPDGARFLTASDDESVRVWDAAKRPAASGKNPLEGRVAIAVFSPSGDKVLLASGGNIHVWNAATWTEKFVAQVHPDAESETRYASFTADGATIVAAANDALVLFDAETGAEIARLKAPKRLTVKDANRVVACALSTDGSRLAYADRDNRVILWNPVSRAPVRANLVEGPTGSDDIVTLTFSPDSRMLAASTAKEFKLLDAASGEEIARVNMQAGRELVWLSDAGLMSANLFGAPVSFYDPLTSVPAGTGETAGIHGAGSQRKWTVSPDGRVLARWREGLELIRIADAGTPIALTGHEGVVSDCVFSPDGAWLATASADKTLKLWSVKEARGAASFWAESFSSCAWSPDGNTVVAGGNDGGVYALRLEAAADAPAVRLKLCGGTYGGAE